MVLKIQEKGLDVPSRLLKELQRASQLRDVGQRLYKLDLHRAKLTDAHVRATSPGRGIQMIASEPSLAHWIEELGPENYQLFVVNYSRSKSTPTMRYLTEHTLYCTLEG